MAHFATACLTARNKHGVAEASLWVLASCRADWVSMLPSSRESTNYQQNSHTQPFLAILGQLPNRKFVEWAGSPLSKGRIGTLCGHQRCHGESERRVARGVWGHTKDQTCCRCCNGVDTKAANHGQKERKKRERESSRLGVTKRRRAEVEEDKDRAKDDDKVQGPGKTTLRNGR